MKGIYLFACRARHENYDLDCLQHQDFVYGGKRVNNDGYNQGGSNVHVVIEKWLKYITKE